MTSVVDKLYGTYISPKFNQRQIDICTLSTCIVPGHNVGHEKYEQGFSKAQPNLIHDTTQSPESVRWMGEASSSKRMSSPGMSQAYRVIITAFGFLCATILLSKVSLNHKDRAVCAQ